MSTQCTVWKFHKITPLLIFFVKPFLQFFCLTFFGKWGFSSPYANYHLSLSLWKMLIMNHFSTLFSKILSYVPYSMLKIMSKLVKSTPWELLRWWVDIGFDNWFWCTDSCTNWSALAIFRHIQAKNHNLQFSKMCFIVNLFSPLIIHVTFTKFLAKIVVVNFCNFHSVWQ